MPRRADLLRHAAAVLVGLAGTAGVFGLSLGMNSQVRARAPEVATVIDTMQVAPKAKPETTRKQRSSPPRKARRTSAPSPAPLLAADLSGLDFGLDDGADAALLGATQALVASLGGAVMDEDAVEDAPTPTTRTPPAYPARARQLGTEGQVTLSFVVDVDGTAQDVTVVEGEPPGVFDAAAIEAVRGWRFEPGRHEGAPVAVRVRQTLRFELE